MKYTIFGFQQSTLIEYGFGFNEAAVLRWFIDFKESNKMQTYTKDGIEYYWVLYQSIIDEFPMINFKDPRKMRAVFNNFVNAKILSKIVVPIIGCGSKTYFAPDINYKKFNIKYSGEAHLCLSGSTNIALSNNENIALSESTNLCLPYNIDPSTIDHSTIDPSININTKNSKKDELLNKNIEDFFNHMKNSFSKSNIKLTNDRIKAIKKLFKKEHAYDESKKYYSLDELKKAYTLFIKNKWNIDNNQHFNLAYFYREIDKLMIPKADISTALVAENIDIKNVSQRELIKNCDFYIDNFGVPDEFKVGLTARELRKKLKELELKKKGENNE